MGRDQLEGVIRFIITTQDVFTIAAVLEILEDNYSGQYDKDIATKLIKELL